MDEQFGFCSEEHGRACEYIAVLREPISRMISSYNYFCVACMEGRHCPNEDERSIHGYTCPAMSLVDYARAQGTTYAKLSSKSVGPLDIKDQHRTISSDHSTLNVMRHDARYDDVMEHLLSNQTRAIPLQHLHEEMVSGRLADALGDPRWPSEWRKINRNALTDILSLPATALLDRGAFRGHAPDPKARVRSEHSVTAAERRELEQILALDITLYKAVLHKWEHPAAVDQRHAERGVET